METRLTSRADFAAATKRHNGDVAHLHGHTYAVAVTAISTLQVDWTLPAAVRQLAGELHGRQLEDMMPGGSTDLDGIAKWFMERLLTAHAGVFEVTVTEDGWLGSLSATAHREIRAAVR